MRALILAGALVAACGLAQTAPAEAPYPRPTVDPTKDWKEPALPAPPEPERKKTSKERREEEKKKKSKG